MSFRPLLLCCYSATQRLVIAVLWVCTLHATHVAQADEGTAAKLPVFTIDTDGKTPEAIGFELGRQTKQAFPTIESYYDAHLTKLLTRSVFTLLIRQSLPSLVQNLPPAYHQEINGVISAWVITQEDRLGDGKLSLNEYLILNFLPDLGFAPDGSGFGAFGKVTANRQPIVGHNMDWLSTPELRSLQSITRYQQGAHSVTSLGFAGIISVLSGFNDRGLFLALLNAQPYSPYPRTQHDTPGLSSAVFDLRSALLKYNGLQQASSELKTKRYSQANNILMADTQQIQVLEHPAYQTGRIRNWNSALHTHRPWKSSQQIAVVDCHLLASLPNTCTDTKDLARWMRLRELAVFTPKDPANLYQISDLLFDRDNRGYEIFNRQTLQSLIYQPSTQHLYLYTPPKNGVHPQSPIHQIYPGFSQQDALNGSKSNSWFHPLALFWLLLIALILFTAWSLIRSR